MPKGVCGFPGVPCGPDPVSHLLGDRRAGAGECGWLLVPRNLLYLLHPICSFKETSVTSRS